MIKYLEFEKEYAKQIYNFVCKTMTKELNLDENTLTRITSDIKDVSKNYIKNGGNFWMAIDSVTNKVVGTVGIKKMDNDNAEFKRFYVQEEYRNRKIGYKLYLIAEQYSKISKIKNLYLASGSELVKAHRIYYKNGWKKIDKNVEKIDMFIRKEAELYKKEIRKEDYSRFKIRIPYNTFAVRSYC